MWFKIGSTSGLQNAESVVAEAPSAVPEVAPVSPDGVGGSGAVSGIQFPPRPQEAPANDMARDIQQRQADQEISENAQRLVVPPPEPIGPVNRSSVDALAQAAENLRQAQALRDQGVIGIDTRPGGGFGQDIIGANEPQIDSNPDGSLKINMVPPSQVTSVAPEDKRPNEPLWKGGRRPKGAVSGDVVSPDASPDMAAEGGEGLQDVVVPTDEGDAPNSAPDVVVSETAQSAAGGEEAAPEPVEEGEKTENAADNVGNESSGATGSQGEVADSMLGVGIPPKGETYPNMAPPMKNVWKKPDEEASAVTPPDNLGVAISAPAEPTQDQLDREEDDRETANYRNGLTLADEADKEEQDAAQGAVGTDVAVQDLGPNAGDRIEPSAVDKRDGVLTDDAVKKLTDEGVIREDATPEDIIPEPGTNLVIDAAKPQDEEIVAGPLQSERTDIVGAEGAPAVSADAKTGEDATPEETVGEGTSTEGGVTGDAILDETTASGLDGASEPATAAEATDTSSQVVEDVIKPAEEYMSMDVQEVFNRISELPPEKRATQIKAEVQKAMKAKMEKENIKSLDELFENVEDYNNKIKEMQDWLTYMTLTSTSASGTDSQ